MIFERAEIADRYVARWLAACDRYRTATRVEDRTTARLEQREILRSVSVAGLNREFNCLLTGDATRSPAEAQA